MVNGSSLVTYFNMMATPVYGLATCKAEEIPGRREEALAVLEALRCAIEVYGYEGRARKAGSGGNTSQGPGSRPWARLLYG